MISPLNDPFVAALFAHHRERASESLLQRLMPVPVPGTERVEQPDFKAMKAAHKAANKVVFLPRKPARHGARCGSLEPTMALIMQEVSKFYQVSKLAILSSRRRKDLVRPRQVAMYLCRELTTQSLVQIGVFLGNRDHTTVIHGADKIERLILTDERLNDEIEILKLWIATYLPAEVEAA